MSLRTKSRVGEIHGSEGLSNYIAFNRCLSELNIAEARFMVLRDNVNIFSGKYCLSEQHPVEPRFMVLWDNVNIFSAKVCASQLNLAVR